MNKKTVLFGILFLFVCLFAAPAVKADAANYTIQKYHVDMKGTKQNTYRMEETIAVHFSSYSHGIYRDIPVVNEVERADGSKDRTTAKVQNISCDGEEYEAQKGKGALFVDGDKIGQNAVLRYRKDGDFIEKFGGGRKSLGDFLTDKKIPLRKRDTLVLLASGDEVLAVFGVEISKKVAIDDNTKNILKLTKK